MKKGFNIASFFSGCGGLDLGFVNAGFSVVFANDNWEGCKDTFELNHKVPLTLKSISSINSVDVPEVLGFVGGPPCQSWSLAGEMKGINDPRGKVFYEYIRLLREKKPLFFLAENVPGIISSTHRDEFNHIISKFEEVGYTVSYALMNAKDFGVPQERKRVIVVGYRKDMGKKFEFPKPQNNVISLKQTIGNLPESVPAQPKNKANMHLEIPNHEHMTGGFSTIYMSRNRKKGWDDVSFTIQAGGRHAPLHPKANSMVKLRADNWKFDENSREEYRRLSVRECARIQTFPDNFIFKYENVADGYKMVGNAVPVKLAEVIATKIGEDLAAYFSEAKAD